MESFFTYKDSEMYYEKTAIESENKIPLLCIHGWGIDHSFLMGTFETAISTNKNLNSKFERYYVDLPGFAKSKAGFVKTADDIIEVLEAFIEKEFSGKKYIVAGNSFGGKLARVLVHRNPEKSLGMILLCPVAKEIGADIPTQSYYQIDNNFCKSLSKEELDFFKGYNAILTKNVWEKYRDYVFEGAKDGAKNPFLNGMLNGNISFDIDKLMEMQKLDKPVLIITGKQDHCVGYKDQMKWIDFYPRSTYIALNGAGHNLNIDRFDLTVEIIKNWFESEFA